MTSLLFFPLPREKESGISLIYRCAAGNGVSTSHLVRDGSGSAFQLTMTSCLWKDRGLCQLMTENTHFTEAERAALTSCFYEPVRYGINTNVSYAGLILPLAAFRRNISLCPGCARDGYLHHMHIFSICDICPVHGERYIDHCPQCAEPLRWNCIDNFTCPCRFDLRNTPTTQYNTYISKQIDSAVETKNEDYFSLLLASLSAMRFAHTPDNRQAIVASCARIATRNKSFFFREIEKLQELYPSLHRRALLAPFLLSPDLTLNNYAQEYLFNASQSRPQSHSSECLCGDLRYSSSELNLMFGQRNSQLDQRRLTGCVPVPDQQFSSIADTLYTCPQLCKALYTRADVTWDSDDQPAEPADDFVLMGLSAAAELLQTNVPTVRRLINHGFLQGFKIVFHEEFSTSIKAVKRFNDRYALRTEIIRKSGLVGKALRRVLADFTPTPVPTTPFAAPLLLYQRKQLPEDLRAYIERRDHAVLQQPATPEDFLTFEAACVKLNMTRKDVMGLRNLGILPTAVYKLKNSKEGVQRCTAAGLAQALEWRCQHVSISEVDVTSGSSPHIIHTRFIVTGAVPSVKLDRIYVKKSDAAWIVAHLKKYVTSVNLQSVMGISANILARLIDHNKLTPLPTDHPDAIAGLIVLHKDEAQQVMSVRPIRGFSRSDKIPLDKGLTPRRTLRSNYLTKPEHLEALARSIGSPPIQPPIVIDDTDT